MITRQLGSISFFSFFSFLSTRPSAFEGASRKEEKKRERKGRRGGKKTNHLLHDTSFSLREGNVPSRLVLNELDLNLATLTAGLRVFIVIIVVLIWSRSLDAASTVGRRVKTGLRIRDTVASNQGGGVRTRVVVGTGGGLRVVVRHGREKYFIFYLKIYFLVG